MAIKELQTRIALKYDSYANWTLDNEATQAAKTNANLVLLQGELGICAIEDKAQGAQTAPTVLFKVGDGVTPFKSLKWASALAADVYAWAKASDVRLTGKSIEFVGGKDAEGNDIIVKSIAINYATPEEVAAAVKVVSDNLDKVDARVVALENKFTGEGSVDAKIATAKQEAIDAAAADATTKAGTAETNAKAYTDEREVEINKAIAQAKTDANSYTDSEVDKLEAADLAINNKIGEGFDGTNTVAKAISDAVTEVKAYADTAETDAVNTAKSYTDTREAAIKLAYEAYADQAEVDAKSYTDDEVDKLEAEDLRLAGLISGNTTAIGNEVTARENAVSAINTKIGTVAEGKDVVTMISDAQTAATTSANGYTDGKVSDLENGQVKTNKEDIAGLKAADTEIRGLITAEKERAEGIESGLRSDVDNIKTFFATAEGETLDTALDTLKEIQDYLNGEGEATGGILSRVGQAETDIDNLETRATNLETRAGNLEAADTAIQGRLDVIEGDAAGSIKKAQADAEAAAKSYTDGRETLIRSELKTAYEAYADKAEEDAVKAAKEYTDGEVADLEAADLAIDNKVKSLQDVVDGYSTKGSIKTAIDAAQGDATQALADAATAQAAAEAAQGDVDALELVVGNETTGLAATKVIADRADAKSINNASRLDTAEGKITTLQGIVETGADSNANLRSAITDLQTLTGTTGAIRQEIADAKKAGTDAAAAVTALAEGQVATNKTNIEALDGRVTAIANDYVKATDLVNDLYIFNCGSSTVATHEAPKAE